VYPVFELPDMDMSDAIVAWWSGNVLDQMEGLQVLWTYDYVWQLFTNAYRPHQLQTHYWTGWHFGDINVTKVHPYWTLIAIVVSRPRVLGLHSVQKNRNNLQTICKGIEFTDLSSIHHLQQGRSHPQLGWASAQAQLQLSFVVSPAITTTLSFSYGFLG
jgi:hypothetical protein